MERTMTSANAKDVVRPSGSLSLPASSDPDDQSRELQKRIDQQAHEITSLKRERESLLKLAIGMAVASYQHSPKQARSRSVAKIADSLRVVGVPLDEGTILRS